MDACFARSLTGSKSVNTVVNCAGIAAATKTLGKKGPHPLDSFHKVFKHAINQPDRTAPNIRPFGTPGKPAPDLHF